MVDIKGITQWFAVELKERMEEEDLQYYHLLGPCKITECEIREYLTSQRLPNLFSLILLADKFECTVNDLLGYDEVEELDIYENYSASSMYFAESQYAACLAERMKRYLDSKAIGFNDLAAKLDISASTLRSWFSRTKPHLPRTDKFLQICEALECTPSELLGY